MWFCFCFRLNYQPNLSLSFPCHQACHLVDSMSSLMIPNSFWNSVISFLLLSCIFISVNRPVHQNPAVQWLITRFLFDQFMTASPLNGGKFAPYCYAFQYIEFYFFVFQYIEYHYIAYHYIEWPNIELPYIAVQFKVFHHIAFQPCAFRKIALQHVALQWAKHEDENRQ